MRRPYVLLFWVVAVLRFVCVPVFVIDDDEAWSSAASLAMKSPWHFYRSAVDHKPPGFVWFYWLVDHLVHCASDPRVVRAAFTLLALLAAAVVGLMARKLAERRDSDRGLQAGEGAKTGTQVAGTQIGWCAATLFLLITALPAPKLLAVTADGLIADLVIFAYAIALFAEFPAFSCWVGAFLSGVFLGMALLVKQTAVFFAIPILFARWPRKWTWKEIPFFAVGAACVLVPCIFGLGVSDFFYWNWTYPAHVLVAVRSRIFESNFQGIETLALFGLAILPLAWILVARLLRAGKAGILGGLRDFRVLWLIAGFCGFAIGKGLFLHYLLLLAAPLALLCADALVAADTRAGERRASSGRWRWFVSPTGVFSWLGAQYVVGCLILAIPSSGVFWGTDLVYFSALGRVMRASLRPGEKAMVWGGSALPLAYAKVAHVTRFVLPRFAVAPYATPLTSGIFHQELSQDLPTLILDLHERGDNQFDNPIESEPFVADLIRAKYKLYISESIPWAKFYFLNPPAPAAGLLSVSGEASDVHALYGRFPAERESWLRLAKLARSQGIERALDADWELRAGASLELLERQSADADTRLRARTLEREALQDRQLRPASPIPGELRAEISQFFSEEASASDGVYPLPMLSPSWWATVATVELQPRVDFGRK